MKKYLLLILSLVFILGCSQKEEVAFVVPEGYRGYMIVIYDQADGEDEKYDNSTRIYDIPSSGILKTKFSADYGWSGFPKVYYGDRSSRELEYYHDFDKIPDGKIVSYGGTTGKTNKDLEGKAFVSFTQHYVGTKEEIKLAVEKANSIDYLELVSN